MKTRDYLKHKASEDKLEKDWNDYILQRNKVTKLIDEAKRTYYNNLLTENANDTSKRWSALKKLLPKKKNVSIQEMSFGEFSSSDNKKVYSTILNKFFTSVADRLKLQSTNAQEQGIYSGNSTIKASVDEFSFTKISVDFVKKELSSLKIKKSSGLKSIHTRFLKTGADVLAEPLTYIYNLLLRTSIVPTAWKSATVTPLDKSGSLSDPNNFRPIAVVPAVMKIFERAIHKQIYKHLTTRKILSTHQSGFRPGHSTATCLFDVSDFILRNMDKGFLTGGIFLDLSKAFDLIDHSILKAKLKSIGIRGCAYSWFEDYLSARTQTVCLNRSNSEEMSMRTGVQQRLY